MSMAPTPTPTPTPTPLKRVSRPLSWKALLTFFGLALFSTSIIYTVWIASTTVVPRSGRITRQVELFNNNDDHGAFFASSSSIASPPNPYAVVVFLSSCADVIFCDFAFTAIQSIIKSGTEADILLMTLKDEPIMVEEFQQLGQQLRNNNNNDDDNNNNNNNHHHHHHQQMKKEIQVITTTVPVQPPKKVSGFVENTDFAKLRAWQLLDYQKVIVLDADILVLKSLTPLFQLDAEFVWTEGAFSPLNCGFMMLKPNNQTFTEMVELISNSSLFNFVTGWNGTGVKDFRGGMRGKLPSAATCQGFLNYYFNLRRNHNNEQKHQLSVSLPPNFVCDCSCLHSNRSLHSITKGDERLGDDNSNLKKNGRQEGTSVVHFSGPCRPFPRGVEWKVKNQLHLRQTYRLLREALGLWMKTNTEALSHLHNPPPGVGDHSFLLMDGGVS